MSDHSRPFGLLPTCLDEQTGNRIGTPLRIVSFRVEIRALGFSNIKQVGTSLSRDVRCEAGHGEG